MIRIRTASADKTSTMFTPRAREPRWTGRSTTHGKHGDIPDEPAGERLHAVRSDDRHGDHCHPGVCRRPELRECGEARPRGGAAPGPLGHEAGNRQLYGGQGKGAPIAGRSGAVWVPEAD